MFGPSGSISRKYTFCLPFLLVNEATGNLEPVPKKRAGWFVGALWAHFGVTLGSLLVFGVDFESVWDHFVMIGESLMVY